MTTKAVFRTEFGEFLDDPGIQIRPGGRKNVALGDIYVFPGLEILSEGSRTDLPARNGRISSSMLPGFAGARGGAFILGAENSGKTSLLKIIAGRLLDAGLYPLYTNGKILRIPGTEYTDQYFLAEYRALYTAGSCEHIGGDPTEKRILLLDNADRIAGGSQALGSFLAGLNSRFGFVILTAVYPIVYNELPPGFSVFGVPEEYAVFSISELGFALREELISRWTGAGVRGDEIEIERMRGRLKGAVDSVLERNLVPSYPVFVLTILQMTDSGESEGPGASSYGQYHEYLITKSLRGITGRENLVAFNELLSELAYMMFSRRSRWISDEDIVALIGRGDRDFNIIPEDPRRVISLLVNADIMAVKESGYEFRYAYIYYYFAAFYFSSNLREEMIRDDVKRLAAGLDDDENANIVLFLTHLSGDPFLLELIARNAEYASAAEEPYAGEEEERYLDELIDELGKFIDKDRKLREIRAEYISPLNTPEKQPIGFRTNGSDIRVMRRKEFLGQGSLRRSRFIDALLRISSEALRTGTVKERRDTPPGLRVNMLILWSSTLRRRKREADRARESLQGREGHASARVGTADEVSFSSTLLGLYMRIYMQSIRRLSVLGEAVRPPGVDNTTDGLMALCSGILRKDRAPACDEVGRFLNDSPERRFAREVLRECASFRAYLFGEDEYSREIAIVLGTGRGMGSNEYR